MDWGWNPATFEAVATVTAALFAGLAALFGWRALRTERKHMAQTLVHAEAAAGRAAEAHERQYARYVSSWTALNEPDDGSLDLALWINNTSDSPVFDVTTWYFIHKQAHYAGFARVIPPATDGPYRLMLKEHHRAAWANWAPAQRAAHNSGLCTVEIHFRDVAGRHWCRDQRGVLRPIPAEQMYAEDGPSHPDGPADSVASALVEG